MGRLLGNEFHHEFAGCGGGGDAEHIMSGGEPDVAGGGNTIEEGEAIPGHGSPAVPGFEDRVGVGFVKIEGSRAFEECEAALIDRGIVASEFHGGTDAIGGLHGGDGYAMLFEDHGVAWAIGRARHGERVAFAGFDGDFAAEDMIEEGGDGSGGEEDMLGGEGAVRGFDASRESGFGLEGGDFGVFEDGDAVGFEESFQFGHESIWAEVAIAFKEPGAAEVRLESRFEFLEFSVFDRFGGDTEAFAGEFIGVGIFFEFVGVLVDEEEADAFPFALEVLPLDDVLVEFGGGIEELVNPFGGLEHVALVATFGEVPHPAKEGRVESRFDVEGGVGLEHRLEGLHDCAWGSEGQHVAGGDVATISV